MASASTISYQDALDSQYLSSSISNLSRSRSSNTLIVRAYKQATQLYLTKRFKESLETLEPIITPPQDIAPTGILTETDDDDYDHDPFGSGQNGNSNSRGNGVAAAPIAQSSRGTRTKVWVFYLSLLHAIVELGPEEGKLVFGSTRWRQLANKAREGTVWEEVVQRGYGGREGDVDPEVVVNLATLLLGHLPTQQLTQQRLEAYLSAVPDEAQQQHLLMLQEGIATPMSNGTSSPKELTTRLKILELFTLHVLPANDEWEYAEQFIEMNEMLDEERREAFLQALEGVKDEREALAQREEELQEMREREIEEQRLADEQRRKDEHRREEERQRAAAAAAASVAAADAAALTATAELEKQRSNPSTHQPASPSHARSSSSTHVPGNRTGTAGSRSKPSNKQPVPASTDLQGANLLTRASVAFNQFQHLVLQAGRNVSGNNVAMMRLLGFLIAFLILFARRDLRERLKRAMSDGWIKVKQTVGMGVKVSYI